jgi:hypothetical protein
MNEMMRMMTGLALAALLAAPMAAHAQDEAPQLEPKLISFNFDGGSAIEYVEAIRATTPDANIVADPLLEHLPVPAADLRNVELHTAVMMLDGMMLQSDGMFIEAHVETIRGQYMQSGVIYRVDAMHGKQNTQSPQTSYIWSLSSILSSGLDPEDVTTAIESALEMMDDLPKANIRFHPETQLLMMRGHPSQVEMVDDTIRTLMQSRQYLSPKEQEALRDAVIASEVAIKESLEKLKSMAQSIFGPGVSEESRLFHGAIHRIGVEYDQQLSIARRQQIKSEQPAE